MTSSKKFPFGQFTASLPCLFPVTEDLCAIDYDPSNAQESKSKGFAQGKFSVFQNLYAVAFQTTLTIIQLPSKPKGANIQFGNDFGGNNEDTGFAGDDEDPVLAEIDFDHALSMLAWDTQGQCLVVSDITGCIHIVKTDGSVVFQKKVFPGSDELKLIALQFFVDSSSQDQQQLVGILSNGNILMMTSLNINALCRHDSSDVSGLAMVLKASKFHNYKLSLLASGDAATAKLVKGIVYQATSSSLNIVVKDNKNLLWEFVLPNDNTHANSGEPLISEEVMAGTTVFDYHIVVNNMGVAYLLATTYQTSSFVVYRLPSEAESGQCLGALQIGGGHNSIDAVRFIPHSGSKVEISVQVILSNQLSTLLLTVVNGSILSHGTELIATGNKIAPIHRLASSPSLGVIPNTAAIFSQDIKFRCFSNVAKMLGGEVVKSFESTNTELNPGSTFGILLGILLRRIACTTSDAVSALISDLTLIVKKRKFAFEIIQLLSIVFDGLNLSNQDWTTILADMQVVLQAPAILEVGKVEAQIVLQQWLHYTSIAKSMEHIAASGNLLDTVKSILPANVEEYLIDLIKQGKSELLLFVLDRNIPLPFSTNSIEDIVDMLPEDTATSVLIDVTQKLLEIHNKGLTRNMAHSGTFSGVSEQSMTTLIDILYNRAQQAAESGNDTTGAKSTAASDSLSLVLYLISLIDRLGIHSPITNSDEEKGEVSVIQEIREDLLKLQKHLQLQTIAHDILHLHDISFKEVIEYGFEGLMFDRLENLPEEDLSNFVEEKLVPLSQLFNIQSDHLLKQWIDETTGGSIIIAVDSDASMDDEEQEEDEENGARRYGDNTGSGNKNVHTCDLSRVILICGCIQNKTILAKATLMLFQIPSIEKKCMCLSKQQYITSSGLRLAELVSKAIENPPAEGSTDVTKSSNTVALDAKLKDQILEALRLFNIRLIAAKYHVQHFDVRDNFHLLATISIIAGTLPSTSDNAAITPTTSLADAMKFALDGSTLRVDIKPMMLRRLFYFVTNSSPSVATSIGSSSNAEMENTSSSYDAEYNSILKHIPIRSVLRDVLLEFTLMAMEEINDICEQIKKKSKRSKTSASSTAGNNINDYQEDERSLCQSVVQFTKAAIKTVETYLDEFEDNQALAAQQRRSATSGVQSGGKFGRQGNSSSSSSSSTASICNHNVLHELKRLFQLQTVYHIYDFSLNDLRKHSSCKLLIEKLASTSVFDWLRRFDETDHEAVSGSSVEEDLEALSTDFNKLRRVCGLVQVSPELLVNAMSKKLLVSGKKNHALEFNKLNLQTRSGRAGSSSLFGEDFHHHHQADAGSMSRQFQNSWALTVDSATLLCQAALKNDKNNSSYGYYGASSSSNTVIDPEESKFEINAYTLAEKMLKTAILDCEGDVISRAVDALTMTDTILKVYDRIEQTTTVGSSSGAGAQTDNSSHASFAALFSTSSSTEGVFTRDGLLMQEENVIPVLTAYCIHEFKRRSIVSSAPSSSSGSSNTTNSLGTSDLENFLFCLQRHENHLVALHVLNRCWGYGQVKNQLLKSSILALCRKVLTYREIDVSFGVACLSALSLEAAEKELKAAVPSIQSDYSRLQTVALVGEEISHLWDNEDFLLLFQGLQTNARWWHTLASIGLSIDYKLFQSSDSAERQTYIESIIPTMLHRNGYDLEMATEYCRSFDIEPELASLCFIELLLLQEPTSSNSSGNTTSSDGNKVQISSNPTSSSWTHRVKAAAVGINQQALLKTLTRVLPRINPLDYEKICFTCIWLLDLMPLFGDGGTAIERLPEEDEEDEETHDLRKASASYQLYVDICNFLLSTSIPSKIMVLIRQVPALSNFYARLSTSDGLYSLRLPLWPLISHPWTVLDPILETSVDFAEKLLPLCYSLGLDKEEFTARSIFAAFKREVHSDDKDASLATGSYGTISSVASNNAKIDKLFDHMKKVVHERLLHPMSKINLWKWIYEEEKVKNKVIAIRALQYGLEVLQPLTAHANQQGDMTSTGNTNKFLMLKQYCQEALQELRFEVCVMKFTSLFPCASYLFDILKPLIAANTSSSTTSSTSSLELLVKYCMELVIEYAWDCQMNGMHNTTCGSTGTASSTMSVVSSTASFSSGVASSGGTSFGLSTQDTAKFRPLSSVLQLVSQVSPIMVEMCGYIVEKLSVSVAGHDVPTTNSNVPTASTLQFLDTTINQMIFKFLAEFNLTTATTSSSGTESTSTTTTTASISNNVDTSIEVNALCKSFYKLSINTPNPAIPTGAEYRRREDLFLAFAIDILILLSPNNTAKQTHINILESVCRNIPSNTSTTGNQVRTFKRFTSRSRLRASIALLLFPYSISTNVTGSSINVSTDLNDILNYTNYLYCLSEMQEIRLSSSEDSLLDALGYMNEITTKPSTNTTIVQLRDKILSGVTGTNTTSFSPLSSGRSLILTWLHDEGQHRDVIELAADVFVRLPMVHLLSSSSSIEQHQQGYSSSLLSSSSDRSFLLLKLINQMIEYKYYRPLQQFLLTLSQISSCLFIEEIVYRNSIIGQEIVEILTSMILSMTDRLLSISKNIRSYNVNSNPNETIWKPRILGIPTIPIVVTTTSNATTSSGLNTTTIDLNSSVIGLTNTNSQDHNDTTSTTTATTSTTSTTKNNRRNMKQIILSSRDLLLQDHIALTTMMNTATASLLAGTNEDYNLEDLCQTLVSTCKLLTLFLSYFHHLQYTSQSIQYTKLLSVVQSIMNWLKNIINELTIKENNKNNVITTSLQSSIMLMMNSKVIEQFTVIASPSLSSEEYLGQFWKGLLVSTSTTSDTTDIHCDATMYQLAFNLLGEKRFRQVLTYCLQSNGNKERSANNTDEEEFDDDTMNLLTVIVQLTLQQDQRTGKDVVTQLASWQNSKQNNFTHTLLIWSLNLMKTSYKDSINQVIAELSSSQREKLMVLVKENKLTSLLA